MQTLKALLDSPALNVFLGTLPLLLTIAWGLFANNKRLDGIDKRLDHVETRLETIGSDVHSIDVRLTRVETRLEAPKSCSPHAKRGALGTEEGEEERFAGAQLSQLASSVTFRAENDES